MNHTEYLRRNLAVASAHGASAAVKAALHRLSKTKRPPKWLMALLHGAQERADMLPKELVSWRDMAPDRPLIAREGRE